MPSFWRKRTSLEKSLIVAVGLATVMAVVFLAAFVAIFVWPAAPSGTVVSYIRRSDEDTTTKENDIIICTTSDCIHTSSKLLLRLDENVDPCEDFYDFTCGSFLKNTRIPDDQSVVNSFVLTNNELMRQIWSLLEEPIASNELRPFILAKIMYQTCMNTTVIEARGIQPLLDLLRRLGGWPVLDGDTWNESSFSWKDSVYRFRDAGHSFDYFIDFSVSTDLKNNTYRIINLDQPSLGLERDYLIQGFSNKMVLAYYSYMVDIAKLLGAKKIRVETELTESLKFEIKLANISLSNDTRRNTTGLHNPFTIMQLSHKFPSIPWLEYINHLLAPHATVGPEEIINVRVPKYVAELEELLKVTPRRVLANYVMWRVTDVSVTFLTEALRRHQLNYVMARTGKTEHESRWRQCSHATNDKMFIAVGALYIRKYFSKHSKATALEMVNDLRHQFRKILTEVDWMEEPTRNAALDKADSMSSHIGYPQELLDDNKLTQFYSKLELSPNMWLESSLNLSLFAIGVSFKRLKKPVNKTDWVIHGSSAIVNAFYLVTDNSINFPAGILQGVFFSPKRPAYMNYGAIGYIIGHEITHGFDNIGHNFDKNGNLVNWWDAQSKKKYLKKAECIIDQYSNYTVTEVGLKVNGVHTQAENIADNGGIKIAYYAYQKWTERHGDESRLPGLEKYNSNQLFWLSMANIYCSASRKEYLKWIVDTELHAPGGIRVIGTISNMEEFARDFQCPVGSKMNSQKKCQVW